MKIGDKVTRVGYTEPDGRQRATVTGLVVVGITDDTVTTSDSFGRIMSIGSDHIAHFVLESPSVPESDCRKKTAKRRHTEPDDILRNISIGSDHPDI